MKTVTTIISATRLSLYANAAFAGTSYTYHAYSRDSKVHEQYFCTVKNANDSNVVTGSDYAEMVKGLIVMVGLIAMWV